MRRIRLLDLGSVPPFRSQTCYHAAARALTADSPDTVILVSPSAPYVCIGFHQDLEKEVDIAYCRERGLPVYRREVGGGAVYLDDDQVFVQWVLHPSSLPAGLEERFRLYIEPLVRTYRSLGIDARHRPVNDIHVGGKKIGGTGAARIADAEVLVGSLMFDFDKAAMARVLKVASEKMRDKIFQSLEQYMTTIREQTGGTPDRRAVKDLYVRHCTAVLDAEIVPGEWTDEEEARAREYDELFVTREWLDWKGAGGRPGVKIHEDVQVVESALKTAGGLVRITARLRSGRIDDLSISGDFTIVPRTAVVAIEEALRGAPADSEAARAIIEDRYQALSAESPGMGPADLAEAVAIAVGRESGGPGRT
jgi:lipoate-protein ligase A